MTTKRNALLVVVLLGWLGSHGLHPWPSRACDSGSETPQGKAKGK